MLIGDIQNKIFNKNEPVEKHFKIYKTNKLSILRIYTIDK